MQDEERLLGWLADSGRAQPASLLGLAACGIAGARVAIAVNRYNRDKSDANFQAVNDAIKTANARCSAGAAT